MHINPTTLKVNQLLGSKDEQYVIPAYQRRYSWREKQLRELLGDIEILEDSDSHLLGSIVCLTQIHTAGINRLELVDGQQRLTTISVLLNCLYERMVEESEYEEAQDLNSLLKARAMGGKPESKVVLDSIDSDEFNRLCKSDLYDESENPNLAKAFEVYRKWASQKSKQELGEFIYKLVNQVLVIRLDVSNANDAFKLFEVINNRGLRLSNADIIKNFLLGNSAKFGEDSLVLARQKWAELLVALDGVNSETFFRIFLSSILKTRVREKEVIGRFKSLFMNQVNEASKLSDYHYYLENYESVDESDQMEEGVDFNVNSDDNSASFEPKEKVPFQSFLDFLLQCGLAYGEIVRVETGNTSIDRRLRFLKMINAQQTYGFLMYLRVSGCDDKAFQKILRLTESFMLRQHICKKRSNENETVFAKLCGVNAKSPEEETKRVYRQFAPSNERFRLDFAHTIFKSTIDRARYCLEQFEVASHGNLDELQVSGADVVEVEHVVPKKIKTKKAKAEHGDWVAYLGPESEAKHNQFVNRIGNLTLFAGLLNKTASNNPYHRKKAAYKSSGIEITKTIPDLYPEFGFNEIEERSELLANKAVELWPIP